MRRITIFVFCLILAGCAKVETVSNNKSSNKTVPVSPTVENKGVAIKQ